MSSPPSDDEAVKPRICTVSGVEFWPFDPRPEMVRIEDIAHALSHMPRFSGHTLKFYSVAEHSVRVARLLRDRGAPLAIQYQGLLHDSAEAYLLDVPSPLKPSYGGYKKAENNLLAVILSTLGAGDGKLDPAIKAADKFILLPERRDLLPHVEWWVGGKLPTFTEFPQIRPWSSPKAKDEFLTLYHHLSDIVCCR